MKAASWRLTRMNVVAKSQAASKNSLQVCKVAYGEGLTTQLNR